MRTGADSDGTSGPAHVAISAETLSGGVFECLPRPRPPRCTYTRGRVALSLHIVVGPKGSVDSRRARARAGMTLRKRLSVFATDNRIPPTVPRLSACPAAERSPGAYARGPSASCRKPQERETRDRKRPAGVASATAQLDEILRSRANNKSGHAKRYYLGSADRTTTMPL